MRDLYSRQEKLAYWTKRIDIDLQEPDRTDVLKLVRHMQDKDRSIGVDHSFWERFFHYLMDTPSQYLSPLFAALLLLPLSPLDVLASILK